MGFIFKSEEINFEFPDWFDRSKTPLWNTSNLKLFFQKNDKFFAL